MRDPERLLDGHLAPDIAELLRALEADAPPDPAVNKRRICAAATTATASQQAADTPASSKLFRLIPWVGLAGVVVATGLVATALPSSDDDGVAGAAQHGAEHAAATVLPVPTEAPTGALIPSLHVDELPSALPLGMRASTSSPTRREPVMGAEDELKNIVAAQSALTANRPLSALAQIARYRATFPTPHFSGEADALEVQALAALGRRDEARTKAERFVAAHPDSPYTQRVRSSAGLNGGDDAY